MKDGPRSMKDIARNRAKAKLGVYSKNQQPLISSAARKKAVAAANAAAKKVVVGKKRRGYKLSPTTKF